MVLVGFYLARRDEAHLGQHAERGDVPFPDRRPETLIPGRCCPVEYRRSGLCCIPLIPDSAEQLEGEFRFTIGCDEAWDQPAIADDVTGAFALNR